LIEPFNYTHKHCFVFGDLIVNGRVSGKLRCVLPRNGYFKRYVPFSQLPYRRY